VKEQGMDSNNIAATLHMDEVGCPHLHVKFSTFNEQKACFKSMDTLEIKDLKDLRSKNEQMIKSLENVEFTTNK
jgi:hypothetical protein